MSDTPTTTTQAPAPRNPLSPQTENEATYQKLDDGSWLGILSPHDTMQTQFRGGSKEECQSKIQSYLKGE